MSLIVVVGAGPASLVTALLLAKDGHQVTLLDRDPAGPGIIHRAWELWERPSVSQFRLPHRLTASGWQRLRVDFPQVAARLKEAGAVPGNAIAGSWRALDGHREGDQRFETIAVRRPVLEAALADTVRSMPGVTVRRGVEVTGLLIGGGSLPRLRGVETRAKETIRADLVVDASGRRSPIPGLLDRSGIARPVEELAKDGFAYYARHFAGPMPPSPIWPLEHHDGLSALVLPGDVGTWSVTFAVPAEDLPLRDLRHAAVWQRVAALFPSLAPWADGIPVSDVLWTADETTSRRPLVVDRRAAVHGLLSVGDAWAVTNPMFGLGLSLAFTQAHLLRDAVQVHGLDDPGKLALRFDEAVQNALTPVYERISRWERHRLAELDATRRGRTYESGDAEWTLSKALDAAAYVDGDVLRGVADVAHLLATPEKAILATGLANRARDLAADAPRVPAPGPSRARLLRAIDEARP
ncbi:NAD(P)/FAD-dependent oxidoreductase [Streptosporangium sp. G11]|uniref:NAD(P)/FAD-dependent oxidoreductase n=1 Tax=Streptosporangium sp. G11 TaxID=3436926 RepID=UPI003EBF8403